MPRKHGTFFSNFFINDSLTFFLSKKMEAQRTLKTEKYIPIHDCIAISSVRFETNFKYFGFRPAIQKQVFVWSASVPL